MENMIRYFDRVKADEELKEKTKNYIKESIAANRGENIGNQYRSKRRQTTLRRLSAAVVPAAACISLIIGGYALYKTSVNYVSYDINPSLELGINFFGKVVEAESFNADGEGLLEESRIMNHSAVEAVEVLTLRADEKGYIKDDGSTVIAVTAESQKTKTAEQLKEKMGNSIQVLLNEKHLNAVVYTDSSNLQIRTEARQYGLSPGKYKLMLALHALEPDINLEQYKEARITDILLKADELLKQKQISPSEDAEWNFNLIRSTAEKINLRHQENERNTNQNEIQSVSPASIEPEQEQEQNQTRYLSPKADSSDRSQTQNENRNEISSSPAIEQEQTTVQNQNQNAGADQADAEQDQTQNQEQGQGQEQNSDTGSDSSGSGQSSQNQKQSDSGQDNSSAGNKKPNNN